MSMDHDQIEERSLAERYVAGTLSADERDGFEEHLVDCPRCLDRIDEAERIRAGLAAIDEERPVRLTPRSGVAVAARPRRRPLVLALAAGLLVGAVPSLLLLREAQRARGNLAGARAAAAAAEARATEGERSLAEERRGRAGAEAALADAEQAQALPVLALASTRGGDDGPGPTLHVPPGAPFAVLAVETGGFAAYAAQLLASDGRVLWRADRLAATGFGVAVALPARLVPPGAYHLVLEGLSGNRRVGAGRFAFRVTAER
jgi:type II secretory pathway pseudopilin PulG